MANDSNSFERRIKVFGERNTATRAVLRIIDDTPGLASAAATPNHKNEDAKLRRHIASVAGKMQRPWRKIYREAIKDETFAGYPPIRAWKHSAPTFDQSYASGGVSVLFTVRNPYSWLLALYRNPYHIMGELPVAVGPFIRQPWMTVARDETDRLLANPMELWNKKLSAYLSFMVHAKRAGVQTSVLKFEDFVSAPQSAFSEAMSALSIECPNPVYDPAPTKKLGLSQKMRQKFYGRADWARDLSSSDVEAITDRVDWNVAGKFGYARGSLVN